MTRMRQAPQTIGTVLPPHEGHEENKAGTTDHRYSFTYPWKSWSEWGRHHRPSVVLPTHESCEETEGSTTDHQYSFTYPWKSWREWGRHHRPWVEFYLPMKVMKRMQQATQTSSTYPRKSWSYFSCFWISLTTTSLSGNFSLRGGPFFSPVQSTTDSEQHKHQNYNVRHSWSLIQQLLSVFHEKGWTRLIRGFYSLIINCHLYLMRIYGLVKEFYSICDH